jgi:hypothetical protein
VPPAYRRTIREVTAAPLMPCAASTRAGGSPIINRLDAARLATERCRDMRRTASARCLTSRPNGTPEQD